MKLKFFFVMLMLLLMMSNVSSSTPATSIGDHAKKSVDSIFIMTFNADDKKNIITHHIPEIINNLQLKTHEIDVNLQNYIYDEKFYSKYKDIIDYTDKINFLYKMSIALSRYSASMNKMISLDDDYPLTTLFNLHEIFFSKTALHSINFLKQFHQFLQFNNSAICDVEMSPQYQLFSIYSLIIYAEVQGFAAMTVAYILKTNESNFNYTDEIEVLKNDKIDTINEYTELFKDKLMKTRNYIRRCNLKGSETEEIIGNKIFAAFENFLYYFVVNQDLLDPNCQSRCDLIPRNSHICKWNGKNCNRGDHHDSCPGLISNCGGNGVRYHVCRRNTNDNSSSRHYYWMKNVRQTTTDFGDTNRPCNFDTYEWFQHKTTFTTATSCHPCLCQCVDGNIYTNSTTIRAFSFLWSETSVDKVATGARLVATDRMIHIQLREANLLPFGKIDKLTERWVPLPEFEYENHFPRVAIYPNGRRLILKRDEDFQSVQEGHADEICLNKFILDGKSLLAGVRFNRHPDKKCFEINAHYVAFSYQYGNISDKVLSKVPAKGTEIMLNQPDDPLKFQSNTYDSKENSFIRIRSSDLLKDAGQTTIPYFDLLEVAPNYSVPLAGIELFHKGQPDGSSGGYIALKIYPIDLSEYMNSSSTTN